MWARAWILLIAIFTPLAASASGLSAIAMHGKCESVEIAQKGAGPRAEQGIESFLQHSQNSIYCREYFDGFLDGWQGRFESSLARAAEITSDDELAEMTEALSRFPFTLQHGERGDDRASHRDLHELRAASSGRRARSRTIRDTAGVRGCVSVSEIGAPSPERLVR